MFAWTLFATLGQSALLAADAGAATVVVLTVPSNFSNESWPEAEDHVRTELRAMGLEVQAVPTKTFGEAARRQELENAIRAHQAIAGLSLSRSIASGAAELWLIDELTGKTSQRSIPAARVRTPGAARIVAIRCVELLHASLIELRLPPMHEKRVPPVVEKILEKELPRAGQPRDLSVRFGATTLSSMSKVGTLGGLELGITKKLGPALALDGAAFGSVLGSSVQRVDATAQIDAMRLSVRLLYNLELASWLSVRAGPSAGALFMRVRGLSSPAYLQRDLVGTTALVGGALAIQAHVTPLAFVQLEGELAAPYPRLEIGLAGRTAARLSRGLVSAQVSLGVQL